MVDTLIYASSATQPFGPSELHELLRVSRSNNERLGVTGMLLFKDGNFMQVLEGEREAVRTLFDRIGRDPRHKGVLVLRHAQQEHRDFSEWSMAFADLGSEQARAVPGYSEFLNTALTARPFSENPSLAHRLLRTFRRTIDPHGR